MLRWEKDLARSRNLPAKRAYRTVCNLITNDYQITNDYELPMITNYQPITD